jgi:GAF domain-containing protein
LDKDTMPPIPQKVPPVADRMIEPFASKVQNIIGAKGLSINDRLLMLLFAACDTLRMDQACITQVEGQQLTVVCATSSNVFPRTVALKDIATKTTGLVLSRKCLVVVNDTAATPMVKSVDLTGQIPGRYIGVPIMFDGAVWGTVELSGQSQADTFSGDEIAAAYVLAAVLALPLALLA